MNNQKNIACFIDGDNISGADYELIIKELKKDGRVINQRLYGDFSKNNTTSNWEKSVNQFGIHSIQVFRSPKKESTDNSMIVDAMTFLNWDTNIDIYAIITSDSDFSSLANAIRMRNKVCIGAGYRQTPNKIINNCDKFIKIETLKNHHNYQGENKNIENFINKISLCNNFKKFIGDFFDFIGRKYLDIKELNIFLDQYDLKKNVIFNGISSRKDIEKAVSKIKFIKFSKGRMFDLRFNTTLINNLIVSIINNSEKDEIVMSYIKDILLNNDSSFHQRNYGFCKMAEFIKTILDNNYNVQLNSKNEYVIVTKNDIMQESIDLSNSNITINQNNTINDVINDVINDIDIIEEENNDELNDSEINEDEFPSLNYVNNNMKYLP